MATERSRVAALLLHPIVLCALGVWLLNDHWGKEAFPGFLTGKLSDIASLIVFPLVPICGLALWRSLPRGWVAGWLFATGFVMASINVSTVAAEGYRFGLAASQWPIRAIAAQDAVAIVPVHLTMDATDLFTIPALLVPAILIARARRA